MQRSIICLLICAVMVGCATPAPVHGNFAVAPAEATSRLVADSMKQLSTLYPAARTQLNLRQTTSDAYGQGLIEALRSRGYAVREFNPSESVLRDSTTPAIGNEAIDFGYVLDQPGRGDIYRLALTVGNKTLTRAYVAQNNTALPAGAWLRKD